MAPLTNNLYVTLCDVSCVRIPWPTCYLCHSVTILCNTPLTPLCVSYVCCNTMQHYVTLLIPCATYVTLVARAFRGRRRARSRHGRRGRRLGTQVIGNTFYVSPPYVTFPPYVICFCMDLATGGAGGSALRYVMLCYGAPSTARQLCRRQLGAAARHSGMMNSSYL
jgi:hypothetical protein